MNKRMWRIDAWTTPDGRATTFCQVEGGMQKVAYYDDEGPPPGFTLVSTEPAERPAADDPDSIEGSPQQIAGVLAEAALESLEI